MVVVEGKEGGMHFVHRSNRRIMRIGSIISHVLRRRRRRLLLQRIMKSMIIINTGIIIKGIIINTGVVIDELDDTQKQMDG